ncbi:MAG: ATP-dependent metallopeptidase FtsH/Yme1/Tma family protein, partial [Lachnospiraceae bacterium]|nr:ATP-dependent metallopeptidase FtsH/Yme1/Tma family protein [Lachnospiraceae bacterium]
MKDIQKKPRRPMAIYWLISLVVLILLNTFVFPFLFNYNIKQVDYSTFLNMLNENNVATVQMDSNYIYFTDKAEEPAYYQTATFEDPGLINRLTEANVKFGRVVEKNNSLLYSIISTLITVAIFVFLGR